MAQVSAVASGADFAAGVKTFLGSCQWSMTTLGKASGVSPSAISQLLSGKYLGDSAAVRVKVESVMKREMEKSVAAATSGGFIRTSVAVRVFDVAQDCRLFGDIGVCYSAAGLGKTEAVREFARQNADVILVEADPGYTAKFLFSEIRDIVGGGSSPRANLHDIFQECCKRLKGSGRLLIVDEAEQLPYKALEMLRRLHGKTGVGILLTGMPKLLANLRGPRGEYAQLYSRVGLAVKLKPLTDADVALVIGRFLPKCPGKVQAALGSEAAGNARRLFKIIARSKRVAQINHRDIDEEVVRRAAGTIKLEVMS
ncbi:MAG: AAA family ATPase [Chitinispirillales bacterium]|jgi:DNA transposition AAA+ family ATPase|nr:AAA family ATPase [Chitinispirillales bacterium]